jgi:copper resistance protein D
MMWFAATRAIHFGACLILLAVWAFDRIVVVAPTGRAAIAGTWDRIARWLVLPALALALISGVAWFAFVAMAMSGLPASQALQPRILRLVLFHTQFGGVWQWRSVFWIASALTAGWILRLRASTLRSALTWLAILFGTMLLGSLAWAGHGRNGTPAWWHEAADVSHLVVSALWPGGLLPLVLVLLCCGGTADRLGALPDIVNRFSAVSFVCVAILASSGLVNSWYMLRRVSDLVESTYGRVLLFKIGLFCVMVALAAYNRFRLKPRLSTDARGKIAAQLRVTVAAEVIFGIIVVLVVGWLGMLPPPGG